MKTLLLLSLLLSLISTSFADDVNEGLLWTQNNWYKIDPSYKGPFPDKNDTRRFNLQGELVGWEATLYSQREVYIDCKTYGSTGSMSVDLTDTDIQFPSCADLDPKAGQKICELVEKRYGSTDIIYTGCDDSHTSEK